jgi:hypothetical protein
MFLSGYPGVRWRAGRQRHGVAPGTANCPRGSQVAGLLPLGLSITAVAATPRELPSPKPRCPGGTSPHRRIHGSFRLGLINACYPSGRVGRAGRRGTFTGQCCQPLCAGDATKHLSDPWVVTEFRRHGTSCQSFIRSRGLAYRSGRIVTPPALSSPGPFAATRCRATLASYPLRLLGTAKPCLIAFGEVRVRISEQARTRPGRI